MNLIRLFCICGLMASCFTGVARAGLFLGEAALSESVIFARDPMFDATGIVGAIDATGSRFQGGSGTLIAPEWVLVSGHQIFKEGNTPWNDFQFSFDADVSPSNTERRFVEVEAAFAFPGYNLGVAAGKGDDIGLLKLSEPVLDRQPIERFRGNDESNTEFAVAGYGFPGVFLNDHRPFDALRRGGRNIADLITPGSVTSVIFDLQYWLSEFDNLPRDNPFPLEWRGTDGDSGSGWLSFIDGELQLIGVTSFEVGLSTGAIRVSQYNDWIDATIAANTVPEPSSLLLATITVVGILQERRLTNFLRRARPT